MQQKKVIAISGMPGAGKGVASEAGKSLGFEAFVLGDVIREETERRGIEPTPKNMGNVMLELRANEGVAVVAKRLLPKIESARSSTVIVEGVRSMHELQELQSKYEAITVAIHASPKTRFQRLLSRKRSDDPKTWEVFFERDSRELNVGLGHVIALADLVLINEGTIVDLQSEFKKEISRLGFV
ncbi:MAG TPA: AAA family ATPase [Candidatus Acidoferrum sp.]|nr:AAA family ATPase [Candidatus Acidoferrum sp.]